MGTQCCWEAQSLYWALDTIHSLLTPHTIMAPWAQSKVMNTVVTSKEHDSFTHQPSRQQQWNSLPTGRNMVYQTFWSSKILKGWNPSFPADSGFQESYPLSLFHRLPGYGDWRERFTMVHYLSWDWPTRGRSIRVMVDSFITPVRTNLFYSLVAVKNQD